jgi:glycosyltransferase 2 family protein
MQRLLLAAKWLWIILLTAGVAWYLTQNFADVFVELQKISVPHVLASVLLLLTGRLLIVQLVQESLAVVGHERPYRAVFQIVALSELGKYLPGGIWHFVGRAAYYRQDGLTIKEATRAMFLEIIWLVVSSALGGCILLLRYNATLNNFVIIMAFITLWLVVITFTLRRSKAKLKSRRIFYLFLLQVGVWLSLGMSYWVLLPHPSNVDLTLTLGAFAISWLVGFLTILAPGGIGTREAAITALMLPVFAAQTTLILASIHRLLWIGVEILMGLVAIFIRRNIIHPPVSE